MALIADVFDVILKDVTGDVIGTTTLQEAGIEFSVSENEVRAGKGNQLIGVLHVSRDININLTDVEFKYDWLAKQLGQTVVTGAGVAYAMPKWYKVATDAIELDETPVSVNDIAIYDAKGIKLIPTTDFTLTGKTVEIIKLGIDDGDEVEVRTFKYATKPETQTIEIDNAVFGKGVTAVLETIEIDGDETVVAKIQYQFDNAVPTGNFSVNTQSERNATTQAFNLRVIKPKTSTVVGRVVRIPV
ncbi:hypothetical protein D3C73_185640 [compost metagenome]